jgi:hypothetical protein
VLRILSVKLILNAYSTAQAWEDWNFFVDHHNEYRDNQQDKRIALSEMLPTVVSSTSSRNSQNSHDTARSAFPGLGRRVPLRPLAQRRSARLFHPRRRANRRLHSQFGIYDDATWTSSAEPRSALANHLSGFAFLDEVLEFVRDVFQLAKRRDRSVPKRALSWTITLTRS